MLMKIGSNLKGKNFLNQELTSVVCGGKKMKIVELLPLKVYSLGPCQTKSAESYSYHLVRPSVHPSVCLSVHPS